MLYNWCCIDITRSGCMITIVCVTYSFKFWYTERWRITSRTYSIQLSIVMAHYWKIILSLISLLNQPHKVVGSAQPPRSKLTKSGQWTVPDLVTQLEHERWTTPYQLRMELRLSTQHAAAMRFTSCTRARGPPWGILPINHDTGRWNLIKSKSTKYQMAKILTLKGGSRLFSDFKMCTQRMGISPKTGCPWDKCRLRQRSDRRPKSHRSY